MTATLQDELVARAAHNAARLEEFFVAHRDWVTDAAGIEALHALHGALSRALEGGLRPLLDRHLLEAPRGEPEWCVAPLPRGQLEAARVQRFGVFVQQLGDWLMTLPAVRASDRGRGLLAALARALAGAAAAVERMLAASGMEVAPLSPERPSHPPAPEPSPEAPGGTPAPARSSQLTEAARQARLVLEDTERTPVLQTFQGVVELTYEAQEALGRLLEQAGITYNSYQRHKLERKVLQWVQATPEGTVLVIRVGDLSGVPEPYPTYAARE